ncbi:uncharacterized protein LOC144354100 [Saccoglossus kowalevskii]
MLRLLLLSFLIHVCDVQAQSIPPPGVSYLGLGYNILDGNPWGRKEMNGGLDPGIRTENRILELTFDEGYLSDNLLYLRPDEVMYDITDTCSVVVTNYTFWGTASYQEDLINNVQRISGTPHSVNSEFTTSSLFSTVYGACNLNGDVMSEERSVCDRGTAKYQTEKAGILQYPLSSGFASAVCSLPNTYDEEIYMNFLDTWGTDVIVEVGLGTKQSEVSSYSRSEFCFFASENYDTTVSYGGSYNGFTDSVIVDMNAFDSLASTSFGKYLTTLETGSDELIEPIALKIISMDDIFLIDYWGDFCQFVVDGTCILDDVAELPSKRANLVLALQGYASWREAPVPSDPIVQTEVTWPEGTYGIPQTTTGCPVATGFSWNTGRRNQDTEDLGANSWSNPYDLAGPYAVNDMTQNFCMKTLGTVSVSDWQWASSEYCIYQSKPCPSGFNQGNVFWDDEDTFNGNTASGTLPDGTYNSDTRINFCCREDGSPTKIMYLPTARPFALIKRTTSCPNVYGMSVSHQWFYWDCENTAPTTSTGGFHPYEDGGEDDHRLHYCYYY